MLNLVESFDMNDNMVGSAIGSFDGKAIERIFE
jgi:hypothetical protein